MSEMICLNCFNPCGDKDVFCSHCGGDPKSRAQEIADALPRGTIIGAKYLLGKALGQGGFGITYIAFDYISKRRVAVKELFVKNSVTRDGNRITISALTENDRVYVDEAKRRFIEEANILDRFGPYPETPNIYEWLEENGTQYYVMEFVSGVSFKQLITQSGGSVSVDKAKSVLLPIGRMLAVMHNNGYIHRDVSPDNIIVSDDGSVHLIDFGSAGKTAMQNFLRVTKSGYSPIEMYNDLPQGTYTDVYAYAACFYAAVTGYLVPSADEREATGESPQEPFCSDTLLCSAVEKALALNPNQRCATMQEMFALMQVNIETLSAVQPQNSAAIPIITFPVNAQSQPPVYAPPQQPPVYANPPVQPPVYANPQPPVYAPPPRGGSAQKQSNTLFICAGGIGFGGFILSYLADNLLLAAVAAIPFTVCLICGIVLRNANK